MVNNYKIPQILVKKLMSMNNTNLNKNNKIKKIAKKIFIKVVFQVRPYYLFKKNSIDYLNFKQENKVVLVFLNLLINL